MMFNYYCCVFFALLVHFVLQYDYDSISKNKDIFSVAHSLLVVVFVLLLKLPGTFYTYDYVRISQKQKKRRQKKRRRKKHHQKDKQLSTLNAYIVGLVSP